MPRWYIRGRMEMGTGKRMCSNVIGSLVTTRKKQYLIKGVPEDAEFYSERTEQMHTDAPRNEKGVPIHGLGITPHAMISPHVTYNCPKCEVVTYVYASDYLKLSGPQHCPLCKDERLDRRFPPKVEDAN